MDIYLSSHAVRVLPEIRTISKTGFSAQWSITRFASSVEPTWDALRNPMGLPEAYRRAFGVALVEPTDLYFMTERATKYGFLFLALTFGAFFLFELLAHLREVPSRLERPCP